MGGLGALAVAAELARLRIHWLGRLLVGWIRPLLKPQEMHRVTGASFLAWGALLALLLLGHEASRVGILIQAWGDPAGALVGTLWGRHRIRGLKSLEGSLAYFVGACLAIGTLTALGWGVPWWAGVAGAASATLVEALNPPPDDNLWGPIAAAAGVWTITHL
ncbi:MAG: diacylglycerol/polyprenol kinase family protein [Dehalococcoidia bacterium]